MRFAVIIPCENFETLGIQCQDIVPSVVPQEIPWEDPVLAVRNLRTVMRGEPWRNRWFPLISESPRLPNGTTYEPCMAYQAEEC